MPMTGVTRLHRRPRRGGTRRCSTSSTAAASSSSTVLHGSGHDVYPSAAAPAARCIADQLSNLLTCASAIPASSAVSRGEQELPAAGSRADGLEVRGYALRDDFDADHDVAECTAPNVFLRDGERSTARTSSMRAVTRRWVAGTSSTSPRTATPGGVGGLAQGLAAGPRPYTWGGWHEKYDHTL